MPRFQKNKRDDAPPTGEPMVWLTSLGLATGLLLVAWLLVVILVNGMAHFWPKRVVEITLKPESGFEVSGGSVLAAEVRGQRNKADGEPETWYFVGNRRVYGESFKWVDDKAVLETRSPDDVLVIERMQYGRAIGYPVAVRLGDGSEIAADDGEFDKALRQLARDAHHSREEIEEVRKKKVGKLARRLGELELEEFRIRKKHGEGTEAYRRALDALEQERAELEAESDKFAAEANELEDELNSNLFVYRLSTGEVRELPAGELIDAYYPNELGWWARVGRFLGAIWKFLTENPREANTEGGVFPAIFGTFVMTVLMSLLVTPLGVVAAIYLREYAKQGPLVRSVRIAVNNLAGVPSIVFGVFGLGFFIYVVGDGLDHFLFPTRTEAGIATFKGGGLLWASATLALMTIPVVIVATEEALAAVPRGAREASLACGASKWQTIQRIVLPAALPGIITGMVLAMARGAGEVAPLMLVGVIPEAEELPISATFPFGLDQKFMHLGFNIFDLGFQAPDSEAAKPMVFATTLLLIVLVVVLNLGAILLRERVRRKLTSAAF